ncbi:DUF211 domain-containing protein [Halomicrobium salinisoli]|uniref:DUF211 domain-containing protein n=1 Tax=Halomicrobium salinisoli TaxID=2878391 RepID=UPI001CF0929B|nr:DUF211 domain-containing protein [Halomicrobium salinisoli]
MLPVRRLVLDVLKPHEPPLPEFTTQLSDAESVEGVSASLLEHDKEVQNVEVTLSGEALTYESIEEAVEALGGTVHSVDQVACGELAADGRPSEDD